MQLSPPSSGGGALHKWCIGNVPDPFPWKVVWLRETNMKLSLQSVVTAVYGNVLRV